MTGTPDPAAGPTAAAATTVVAASIANAATVQAAIDTHVATYQQQLEAKIKATLADVNTGWKEISGDVKSIIAGSGVTLGTGSTAHTMPRWAIWGGLVLAIVGAIALGGVVLAHLPIKL